MHATVEKDGRLKGLAEAEASGLRAHRSDTHKRERETLRGKPLPCASTSPHRSCAHLHCLAVELTWRGKSWLLRAPMRAGGTVISQSRNNRTRGQPAVRASSGCPVPGLGRQSTAGATGRGQHRLTERLEHARRGAHRRGKSLHRFFVCPFCDFFQRGCEHSAPLRGRQQQIIQSSTTMRL
jgi:hypothetical protein